LNTVISILVDNGWFEPGRGYDKTVYLTHGAAQSMLLSRDGRPECFVKFTDQSSLALEAQRCQAAARQFPGLAPEFFGYACKGALEVMATRAVVFRSVNAGLMRSARHAAGVQAGLESYFQRMVEGARPAGTHRAWVDEYLAYFDRLAWCDPARECLRQMLSALSTLPLHDQHGDFVVNNLGTRGDGSLAVFDWEDYGAVDVPGLDLFTLEMSLLDELTEMTAADRPPREAGLDIDRICKAIGLPRPLYEQLRTGYAFVFRFLKRNYGPDIRGRVDQLLHRLGAARVPA
jgi:hypothetical protein